MDYEGMAEGFRVIATETGADLFNLIAATKGECLMSDEDVEKISEIAGSL